MTESSSLISTFLKLATSLTPPPYFAVHVGSGSGSPDEPKAKKLRARRKANKVASTSRKQNRRK